jgi:ABC-type transport system involved in multi-copper enzyme maturation permease subunit
MVKYELKVIFKDKKFYMILLLFVVLMMYDLSLNHWNYFEAIDFHSRRDYTNLLQLGHPAHVSYLSATSMGHIAQMIIEWLLPIYILYIYGDHIIHERKSGYYNLLLLKSGKKRVIISKYIIAFFIGFIVMLIPLILNYIVSIFFFYGGKDFYGATLADFPDHLVFAFSMKHPYIAYSIYIIVMSIISGGISMFSIGLSCFLRQYRYLYLGCFLIWYLQIIAPNSITYVTQPFIEYDLPYIIPAILCFLGISAFITVAGYIYSLKRDEI